MSKIYVILTIAFVGIFIGSCGRRHEGEQRLSNFVSITDDEDKGVKEVLAFYDGVCKYSVGNKQGKHFFELQLSKSARIEKYFQRAEMPASNIAYLFFRNIQTESKKYDEIHTVLVFDDGTSLTFSYSIDTLNIVNAKFAVLQNVVNLIGKNDFKGLRNLFDESGMQSSDKDKMITNLQKYQSVLGQEKEFLPYGFKYYQSENGRTGLHLSGIVVRTKQNNEISIDLGAILGENKIWKLNYKL
jgi:hypothetical protein